RRAATGRKSEDGKWRIENGIHHQRKRLPFSILHSLFSLMIAMELTHPIIFEPLFMERIWGGRRLESLFGKRLPPATRIGESWEIVDREEAQSVVHNEPLRGKTLHELWTQYRNEIFGKKLAPSASRFPLLFKL